MYPSQLRIDTSAPIVGSSVMSSHLRTPSPMTGASANGALRVQGLGPRTRSASTSSAASSLSIVSPAPSSMNASAASLPLSAGSAGSQGSVKAPQLQLNTSNLLPRRTPSPALSSPSSPSYLASGPSNPERALAQGELPEYVLAMHDYVPQQGSAAATCLSFRAGQVIRVLNRDSSGWWDGELEDRRGWFPSNYVNSDMDEYEEEDVQDKEGEGEDLTQVPMGSHHSHSNSASSVTSWASSTSRELDHPSMSTSDTTHDPENETDPAFPPIMDPLVHGLSLLQNAVRSHRVSHFQPSTACIISCVRSVLTATDTLNRDAPVLQLHPVLAAERAQILAILASLVAQAKRASEEGIGEDRQEMEIAAMMRLGGQVFACVRRFLAVAVQCGVELPERRQTYLVSASASNSRSTSPVRSPTAKTVLRSPVRTRKWTQHSHTPTHGKNGERTSLSFDATPGRGAYLQTPRAKGRNMMPGTLGSGMKAKSLSDLRAQRIKEEETPVPAVPAVPQRTLRRRKPTTSISSSASSSSLSSIDSMSSSPKPSFPRGPCTSAQIQDVLRSTHSQYLSTIAAFIGHAHSHSRFSHASSTGHMYDLVREIVEMACKLLTLVEAILVHPDVPESRRMNLQMAKEGVYTVTSALAEAVRLLTVPLPADVTDEEEKQGLIRSATAALKMGSDCVAAAKMCLSRPMGDERPFILHVPDLSPAMVAPSSAWPGSRQRTLTRATSMSALRTSMDDDNEFRQPTPIGRGIPDSSSGEESSGSASKSLSMRSEDTNITVPDEKTAPSRKVPPAPLNLSRAVPVEVPLTSPASFARTDDGTTWEGSLRGQPGTLEEKILTGALPAIPSDISPYGHGFTDPMGWLLSHDYPLDDVAYNSDGHLVGATLGVLVEKMTPHDSIVDPAFSAVFFLTFRLFSSPTDLVDALIARYNLLPPPGIAEDMVQVWQQRKGIPVRLRVSNFIKMWVESFWRRGVDDVALPSLTKFTRDGLGSMFPGPAQRIIDLLDKRMQSKDMAISPKGDRTRDPGMQINPPVAAMPVSEIPRPSMTKTLLAALRARSFQTISITDFDALELARQLTIMECILYCAIQPEEILEVGQEGKKSENVKALSTLSTVVTGWVTESILDEQDTKKRAGLVKFFIKVADRCTSLDNFSTSRSMLAALDSSTIARLHQTWGVVPQKNKAQLESMRRLADHSRNYHQYRSTLRNTAPPAVPFLGLYLTDVTFCREGNPSHRASPMNGEKKLINFNKYHKLARIVQDMQRFQVPYQLKAIPEVQQYLNFVFDRSRRTSDLQDLYRRSLMVEPRRAADPAPPVPGGDSKQLFSWASRGPLQQADNVAAKVDNVTS